jgi:hypothetical protein
MTRIIQISAVVIPVGTPPVQTGALFCLTEDGRIARYNMTQDKWDQIGMPPGFDKEHVGAIATTRLPKGFELIKNNRTQTWTWRAVGSDAVPPPAIEGEVGELFDSKDDAINDAKQRYLLKATETPP